jgi:hypothetical protein
MNARDDRTLLLKQTNSCQERERVKLFHPSCQVPALTLAVDGERWRDLKLISNEDGGIKPGYKPLNSYTWAWTLNCTTPHPVRFNPSGGVRVRQGKIWYWAPTFYMLICLHTAGRSTLQVFTPMKLATAWRDSSRHVMGSRRLPRPAARAGGGYELALCDRIIMDDRSSP